MKAHLWMLLALLATACSEAPIQIAPRYYAGQLKPYSVSTFEQEWAKSEGKEINELAILQDLLANRTADFDWSLLWRSFASGRSSLPKSAGAWDLLLQDPFLKCAPKVIDAYGEFASMNFGPQEGGLERNIRLTEKVLPPLCSLPLSQSLRGQLLLKIQSSPREFPDQSSLERTQDKIAAQILIAPGDPLVVQPQWEKYLEARLQSQVRATAEFSELLRVIDQDDIKRDPARKTSVEFILEKNVTWETGLIRVLKNRLGLSNLISMLRNHRPAYAFSRLKESEQNYFLNQLFEILKGGDSQESLQGLFLVFDYLNQLELNRSLQYLAALDLFVTDFAVEILKATSDEQLRARSLVRSRRDYPGLNNWLSVLIHPASVTKGGSAVLKIETLNDLLNARTALRLLASEPRAYRDQVKFFCEFWKIHGGAELSFESINNPNARGCLLLSQDSNIEIKPPGLISPDLIVLSEGRGLKLKSSGAITYGWFDSSPDILQSFPQTPPIQERRTQDSAILFPVFIGFTAPEHPNRTTYFTFHFEARRQQIPIDPLVDPAAKKIDSAPNGGTISLETNAGEINFTGLVSHGAFAQGGLPPRLGGAGDTSHRIEGHREFIRSLNKKRVSLGDTSTIELVAMPTREQYRGLIQNLRRLEVMGQKHFVKMDRDLLQLLAKDDREQIEAYLLSKISEAPPDALNLYCDSLQVDPDYQALRLLGRAISNEICHQIYALEKLALASFRQLADLVEREDWNDQTEGQSDWILPDQSMSFPGLAPSSGSGGQIDILTDQHFSVWTAAEAGERFTWPSEWGARGRDGASGQSGKIQIIERKKNHE